MLVKSTGGTGVPLHANKSCRVELQLRVFLNSVIDLGGMSISRFGRFNFGDK
jgi:hypothetical protein